MRRRYEGIYRQKFRLFMVGTRIRQDLAGLAGFFLHTVHPEQFFEIQVQKRNQDWE